MPDPIKCPTCGAWHIRRSHLSTTLMDVPGPTQAEDGTWVYAKDPNTRTTNYRCLECRSMFNVKTRNGEVVDA